MNKLDLKGKVRLLMAFRLIRAYFSLEQIIVTHN